MVQSFNPAHTTNLLQMSIRPVASTKDSLIGARENRQETLEFKMTPSVDRLTDFKATYTGTYNSEGKLALISNKMIVYVQPSAFIRDKLVPSHLVANYTA